MMLMTSMVLGAVAADASQYCVEPPKSEYKKIFQGECYGPETLGFETQTDVKDLKQRVDNCAKKCKEGGYPGFIVLRDAVSSLDGRCFCEKSNSKDCTRVTNKYERYDYVLSAKRNKYAGVSCNTKSGLHDHTQCLIIGCKWSPSMSPTASPTATPEFTHGWCSNYDNAYILNYELDMPSSLFDRMTEAGRDAASAAPSASKELCRDKCVSLFNCESGFWTEDTNCLKPNADGDSYWDKCGSSAGHPRSRACYLFGPGMFKGQLKIKPNITLLKEQYTSENAANIIQLLEDQIRWAPANTYAKWDPTFQAYVGHNGPADEKCDTILKAVPWNVREERVADVYAFKNVKFSYATYSASAGTLPPNSVAPTAAPTRPHVLADCEPFGWLTSNSHCTNIDKCVAACDVPLGRGESTGRLASAQRGAAKANCESGCKSSYVDRLKEKLTEASLKLTAATTCMAQTPNYKPDDSQPGQRCDPVNCLEWKCKADEGSNEPDWCSCYDADRDEDYEKAGCGVDGDDYPCKCKEDENGWNFP